MSSDSCRGVLRFAFLVGLHFAHIRGFNIETRGVQAVTPTNNQEGSWFGQSMVLDITSPEDATVFTSAPLYRKDHITKTTDAPDGAISKCSLKAITGAEEKCTQISFEPGSGMGMTLADVTDDGLLVCGPQWNYQCLNASLPTRMVGKCYIIDRENFQDKNPTMLVSPFVRDCPGELDLVFLLDSSGSITPAEFFVSKRWLLQFLKRYSAGINTGDVRVGIIQYSGDTTERTCDDGNWTRRLQFAMPLGEYTLSSVNEIVANLVGLGHCTLTGDAINVTVDHFSERGRQDSVDVMIVVTDGRSYDPVLEAANHAREKGIAVIAVGVGSEIDERQLDEIADNSQYKFNVSKFEGLITILDDLQNAIIAAEGSFLERSFRNKGGDSNQYITGMSVAKTENGKLYVGAVGAVDGMGSVVSRNISNLTRVETLTSDDLMAMIQLAFNNYTGDDNYLGYAMSSGFFFGPDTEWVAVGMPRFLGQGGVLLFPSHTEDEDIRKSSFVVIPDMPMIGSYFGHTLIVSDLNKDGFDELIVGAPLYIDSGLEDYDEGSVTIIYGGNESTRKLTRSRRCMLVGFDSGSRFGTAIAAAGDLDYDGFPDIVIGAPGYNNRQGEIVIYYGGVGCPSRYQRIPGPDSSNSPYFGYSIAAHEDSASAIVVSSPKTGSFFSFRARPVVDLNVTMAIVDANNDEMVEMDVIKCVRNQNENIPCLILRVCFEIFWRNGTEEQNIDLLNEIILENDLADKRLMFTSNKKQIFSETVTLAANKICGDHLVILREGILSRVNAVDFSERASIKVITAMSEKTDGIVMSPVMSKPESVAVKHINFNKGCMSFDRCVYDLVLRDEQEIANPIHMRAKDEVITMKIGLTNVRDPAFFPKLRVASSQASIIKIISTCSFLENDRQIISYKHAVLGSLMLQNTTCQTEISFTLGSLARFANETEIEITIEAFSLMDDKIETTDATPDNNIIRVARTVKYRTSFNMIGVSEPAEIHYSRNESGRNTLHSQTGSGVFGDADRTVSHTYQVVNSGPFTISGVNITLSWPAVVSSNALPILYMFGFSCEPRSICSCDMSEVCDSVNTRQHHNGHENATLSEDSMCKSHWNATKIPSASDYEIPDDFPFGISQIACRNDGDDMITCRKIWCKISSFMPETNVKIEAKMKFWTPTFKLHKNNSKIYLETMLTLNTANDSYFSTELHQVTVSTATHQYFTTAPLRPERTLDWTLLLIAILIGLILIIILICICWKCGFFASKYKKEMLRAKAILVTEEEMELENTVHRKIIRSKSSSSDSDSSAFVIDACPETFVSTPRRSNTDEDQLYLQLPSLREYSREPRASRRRGLSSEPKEESDSARWLVAEDVDSPVPQTHTRVLQSSILDDEANSLLVHQERSNINESVSQDETYDIPVFRRVSNPESSEERPDAAFRHA